MGGMSLMGMKAIGVGPDALLFSKPIDTLAAAGRAYGGYLERATNCNDRYAGDEFLENGENRRSNCGPRGRHRRGRLGHHVCIAVVVNKACADGKKMIPRWRCNYG